MSTLTTLPAVETRQLIVREIEPRDVQAFARFMIQEPYQRHIALRLKDEAEVRAFVKRSVSRRGDERRNVFHLAAEEKSSGEAVGDGFLIVQRKGLLEVGWGVHPAMWAMGIGSEIGIALLGLGFERLAAQRMWCKTMAENRASGRLARRIGMRHVQSHPDYPAGGGRFEPVEIFAMTAAEYFELAY
jgi:[ribosomal protein S5]-alanine N-acetyltransferase